MEVIGLMEMSGIRRLVEPYNQVVLGFRQLGEWEWAVSLIDTMRGSGVRPDAYSYSMAMDACKNGGRRGRRRALRLLEELKVDGVNPNTVVYNTLLGLFRDCGEVKHGLLDQVPQKHSEDQDHGDGEGNAGGAHPLQWGSRLGEGGGEGSGNWEEEEDEEEEEEWSIALRLLKEMCLSGGEAAPDKLSFELVMQACVNGGCPDRALSVFRLLRKREANGESAGVSKRGARGGVRGMGVAGVVSAERATFRLALRAAADAGDGAAAVALLDEMRGEGMEDDESSFHLAVTACGRSGMWRESAGLLVQARKDGYKLAIDTCASVVGACAKKARWKEAIAVLREIRPTIQAWVLSFKGAGGGGMGRGNGVGDEGRV
ncbi:unnamed protein product, partial [Choristocarpus tenellus]